MTHYLKARGRVISYFHLDQHLITFLLFTFFVQSADKIISYVSPGLIENVYNNNFVTGSIISLSSVAGLLSDWILPQYLQSSKIIAFLKLFFLFIISTIIFLAAGQFVGIFFIPAMITWGIYYDILRFSDYKIINTITSKSHYLTYWSAHATIKSITTIVAPLIAILILRYNHKYGLLVATFCIILAYVQFLQLKRYSALHSFEHPHKHSLMNKQVLRLIKPLWPLYIFSCTLYIVDASFWTIGILLGESLGTISLLGNFILPAFTVPGLFVLFMTRFIPSKYGKKKALFTSGIIGASILMFAINSTSILILLIGIFISSLFFSICWPLLYTLFEEYMHRVSGKSNELIAIEDSASNVGYIVGPLLSGFLVTLHGYQFAFQILALLVIVAGIVGLVFMKHKVSFV